MPGKRQPTFDKENPDAYNPTPTVSRDRYPLKTSSNTAHITSSASVSKKPASYYYGSPLDAGAKSLPIRQTVTTSDYYTPLDDLSPPRPRSADISHS